MCLIIHSSGHLTIKMLYEQLRPTVVDGKLSILECYDLVLRCNSRGPIESLFLLSPHTLFRGDEVAPVSEASLDRCDWIMKKTVLDPGAGRYALQFDGPADEVPLTFEVTRLVPQIGIPRWIEKASRMDPKLGVFLGTGMTLAEVTFRNGMTIRTYDSRDPQETTYWIRVALIPEIRHLTREPFRFGPTDDALLYVQPCSILSPEQVLDDLETRLNYVAAEPRYKKAASATRNEIFDGVFEKPGTSTRIEDHRISIVTGSDCLVLNTSVDGDCGYHETKACDESSPIALARTWFTGARHYASSDPMTLAREVYNYVKSYATIEEAAKTKEAISSALSCQSHSNVSHVVEALRAIDLVGSPKEGYHMVNRPTLEDDQLFLKRVEGAAEIDLGGRDAAIREAFYGRLPLAPGSEKTSRFWHKGFRIFYDLAYAARTRPAAGPHSAAAGQRRKET